MNNNERILHILDQSTCLTRRQMKDYLSGTMLPEEIHAVEMHISSCPLCSMALDGFEAHNEEALEAISSLNSGFLKDHFDAITPKIHLNSLAPAATFTGKKKRKKSISLLRITSVAAALLLGFGVLWYLAYHSDKPAEHVIAKNEVASEPRAQIQAPAQTERTQDAKEGLVARSTVVANQEPAIQPVIKEDKKVTVAEKDAAKPADDSEPVVATMAAPASPSPPIQAESEIAKTPSINVNDQASLTTGTYAAKNGAPASLGGGRVNSDSYVVDGVQLKQANQKMSARASRQYTPPLVDAKKERKASEEEIDHLQQGDELFGKSKYSSALSHYNKEMNNGDRKRRGQATIMAARCYQALGNKQKAISLLQSVVNEGGPQKRAAKRLLRELEY